MRRAIGHRASLLQGHLRLLLVLAAIFCGISNAYTDERDNSLSLGSCGVRAVCEDGSFDWLYLGRLFDYEHRFRNGLAFLFSPCSFSLDMDTSNAQLFTVLDTSIAYDVVKDDMVALRPLASLGLLSDNSRGVVESRFGLQFSLRQFSEESIVRFDYVSIEVGYKTNYRGAEGFYADAGVDLLWVFTILGKGPAADRAKTEEDRSR